jgi:hypothetical protein
MEKITGDTFPVKDQIKALGGKWNSRERCWEVPDDKADQVWALVGGKPQPKAAPKKTVAATPKAAVEKPPTPEDIAANHYPTDQPAVRIGEVRGMPVFVKWYGVIFAVDPKALGKGNPSDAVRSIAFRPDSSEIATGSFRYEKLTPEETTELKATAEPVWRRLKEEHDAKEAPRWNIVGTLRGRPIRLETDGSFAALTWVGPIKDHRFYRPDQGKVRFDYSDVEPLTPEEVELVDPLYGLVEAAKAEHAAKQKRDRAEQMQRWAEECRTKDRWPLSEGSGYGGRPFEVGQTYRLTKSQTAEGYPEYVTILEASQRYYREDGMSFGVGDERGYVYSAKARAATEEEIAPVRERIEARKQAKAAAETLKQVAAGIRKTGERPRGPEGESVDADRDGTRVNIGTGQNIYGGGDWFVVGPEWIWYVENNGTDGGDWSCNNVRTGGAGAIGWRVAARPELAEQIRTLATTAWPKED